MVQVGLLAVGLWCLLLAGCGQPAPPTTNFYHALHSGDLDQIKRHLYWGTEVNQAGPNGRYPLQVAVAQGRLAIARELLDHGARLDLIDSTGHTPLYSALANGRVPAAELLLSRGAADDLQLLLFTLVQDGALDRDSLALLLERGVMINQLGPDGLAALHIAVRNNQLKMTKWLLQDDADVNQLTASGATALSLAVALERDPNLIQLLEQYGAIR